MQNFLHRSEDKGHIGWPRSLGPGSQETWSLVSIPLHVSSFGPNSKCNISYLGNALVLDLARMLESTISNGSQHLGFEQEISEAA